MYSGCFGNVCHGYPDCISEVSGNVVVLYGGKKFLFGAASLPIPAWLMYTVLVPEGGGVVARHVCCESFMYGLGVCDCAGGCVK